MIVKQYTANTVEDLLILPIEMETNSNFVLVFGNRNELEKEALFPHLKPIFPNADILFCSTCGQINGTELIDAGIVVTSVELQYSKSIAKSVSTADYQDSYSVGAALVETLPAEDLKHLFVISDGQNVNGTDLVQGINSCIPKGVSVTGGLAGDDDRFEKTLVGLNSPAQTDLVLAIGFYGERLHISCGSQGGWTPFGPERQVTKSEKNVLYELDGKSALELYKSYLGNLAEQLPGSALLFPLCVRTEDSNRALVRTILSVNEDNNSMTFAGNLPEGSFVRLMKSNTENLIDGANDAANDCKNTHQPELSIMVSCVGRKLVLNQLAEEEVENAYEVLGSNVNTGFYSYGEICPPDEASHSELHNQTMTITTISEI